VRRRQARLFPARLTCALGLLVSIGLLLVPANAPAAQVHVLSSSFGSAGSGDGQLELADPNLFLTGAPGSGLAVNQETGDVYVADTGNHRIAQFSSTGIFIRAFGADVGGAGIDVCTAGCVAGASGSSPGAFESPIFVAIDNSPGGSGEVYVADTANDLITKFEADGTLLSSWGTGGQLDGSEATSPPAPFAGPFAEVDGIAVDAAGNLNVLENADHALFRFAPDSTFLTDFETPRGSARGGLAVDPDGSFFKINASPSVEKFKADGADVGQVSSNGNSEGLAVDPSTGELFVGRQGNTIDVYAFEPSGEVLGTGCTPASFAGCSPTESFGEGDLTSAAGLAVDGSSHTVYVADAGADAIRVFEPVTTPEALTEAATAITPTTATLNGAVNPNGAPLAECFFEWGETKSYGNIAPCEEPDAAEVGEGTSPVPVHADLSGLKAGTTYHFRLVAENANGPSEGEDEEFRTLGPTIEDQLASQVTATEARIGGQINPRGEATSFLVQYVTEAQFLASGYAEAKSAPTPPGNVGSGVVFKGVVQQLSGLTPDTAYRFRLVAANATATAQGPDQSFTTFTTATGLPDGRAWEMVSPSQKAGEVIPPEPISGQLGGSCAECLPGVNVPTMPMQSAPDGEAVLYEGQPFSAGLASGPNEYIAERGPSGWSTQSLSSPITTGQYEAFSSDLSQGVLYQVGPTLSPEAPLRGGKAFANLYLRGEDGSFRPLIIAEPPQRDPGIPTPGENQFQIRYAGANAGTSSAAELSHLIFEANDALTEAVPGIAPKAPEVEVGQFCSFAGAECNLYKWQGGELRLLNVLPDNESAASNAVIGSGRLLTVGLPEYQAPNLDHAISEDGSRIFWSSEESGHVYARIDGSRTLEIPGPALCKQSVELENRVCFLTASADGSSVLLSDGQVYELDEEAEAYEPGTDLSEGQGGFKGILGASEDLSRIYFVDTAELTGGEENANGEEAEAGKLNLYVSDEGEAGFIGALLKTDNELAQQGRYGAWKAARPDRTAQVSPDGAYLAFMSRAPLTGYDNARKEGGECTVGAGAACLEVFIYAAETETLTCASCNPSGQRPLGPSNLSLLRPVSALGETSPPFPQPGNLSIAGGGRLFFESQDVLSPQDTNGHIQDVYEWEPQGVGSCKRAAGCVYLISSGHSTNDSMFLDSSDNGSDAFFITREQLSLADRDEQLDLYDARVGGGVPSETETINPECQGEACQPAALLPNDPTPSSSAFNGAGNVTEKAKKRKKKHKRHAKKRNHRQGAKSNRGGAK
jgi:NHL repeat